jgi:regulator of extracellular matrix RemA (YlzA/DUF370 family)
MREIATGGHQAPAGSIQQQAVRDSLPLPGAAIVVTDTAEVIIASVGTESVRHRLWRRGSNRK